MSFSKKLAFTLLLLVGQSFGAIAFVQAKATVNTTTTDCSVTATSNYIAGHTLVVMVFLKSGTVSTVTAGTDTLLFFGRSTSGVAVVEVWTDKSYAGGTAAKATITISGAIKCVGSVAEYSGVSSLGHITGSNANVANPSVSMITQDANNWLVVGFSGSGTGTFTAGTGNLRASGVTSGGSSTTNVGGGICDNTAASATTVTCSVTNADTSWRYVALELRSTSVSGYIQGSPGSVSTSSTGAFSFNFASRTGDFLLACAVWNSNTATFSVTDNAGNVWTAVAALQNFSTSSEQCYYAKNIVANVSPAITATFSASVSWSMVMVEFSNLDTSTPADINSSTFFTGGSTTALASSSTANSFQNEIAVGLWGFLAGSTAAVTSSGAYQAGDLQPISSGISQLTWTHISTCATQQALGTATAPQNNWLGNLLSFKDTGAASCAGGAVIHTLTTLGAGPSL